MTVAAGDRVAEGAWRWLSPAQLLDTPLHGAHRKALVRFLAIAPAGGDD
jgi:hypothetical protein